MENYQSRTYQVQPQVGELKESIRDMVQLQRNYQLSDELFWEIFNERVLLDKQIDVNAFVRDFIPSPVPH
ncbi:hypothetical protein [Spirosoma endbachense]|uniref:Uncharacterized protein n=1 Tax=Spirosoma endbachense TaxID=2666025 RepID=A0A6P1W2L0_9BACT|nr:hypothetical protein [Spirosoma endbachense]QHV99653.1 hypothetical protein GJR95_33655 [Spirosoma endbachense]